MVAGTFWQNTVLLPEPLIDPQAWLRTLCHVTPGQWMLEGIGFYIGMSMRWFRDAFCDTEVAAARHRAWTRTWSWKRRPPRSRRGPAGWSRSCRT